MQQAKSLYVFVFARDLFLSDTVQRAKSLYEDGAEGQEKGGWTSEVACLRQHLNYSFGHCATSNKSVRVRCCT